jgi:hypothetical protein
LTGRATFKAADIILEKNIEYEERMVEVEDIREKFDFKATGLTKIDKTKMVWHLYLPPVAVGALTITSIIFAHKITSKKIAALVVAGGVSERALQEYKDKVVEKLGVRKDQDIRDEIAQDRVNANPVSSNEVLIVGTGEVLFFDELTGRYFQSTMEDVKRAENKVNFELINFMSCSLSHFYEEIGLPPTPYTDSVGWNMNNHMEVKFSTTLSEDKRPCIVISFARNPIADYDKNWN